MPMLPSQSVLRTRRESRQLSGTVSALSGRMKIGSQLSSRPKPRPARSAERRAKRAATGRAIVGISGYDYKPWRGRFYPEALPARRWLEYASRRFNSIELNGTFYSLKSPSVFQRWADDVPERDFVFAVKGGRFLTHNLKLRRSESALGNFFASGVLALGARTGPFLWQLPATYSFDAERMDGFMRLLPRDAREGEAVARQHDQRLRRGALTEAAVNVPYRHAFEVRHPSYFHEEFYSILRDHQCAFVIADSAGKFPIAYEVTADFVYVRLHGSQELYVSGYTDAELDEWAGRIAMWRVLRGRSRDVYVYFDNDAKVHAPFDAQRLIERLR
jgi:uncharacterized protein YecE (DUF72 family)